MELAEALLTLGVGGASDWETLSAESLKRIYLRKVRAHPPERDPQGFQRVREAYELLQTLQAVRTAFRGPPPSFPGTATNTESGPPTSRGEAGAAERAARAHEPEPGSSAFDRFQQALAARQHDAAADALMELYADATLASPRPAPHLVLSLITEQFMRGAQDRGGRLFLAFEEAMARMKVPLSASLAASWKLLAELVALSAEVAPAIICALAGAIESGRFQDASKTLRAELDERGRESRVNLESSLQTLAPTLYQAAWPTTRSVSRKQQRYEESWALRMSCLILVLGSSLTYLIVQPASFRRANQSHTLAGSASAVTGSSEHYLTARGSDVTKLAVLNAEQAKDLDLVTSKVEKVVRFGRCNQLRAAWEEYTNIVRQLKDYESVMRGYQTHRVDAGTTCPQLASELPESP